MYKYLLCWRYLRTRYIALASVVSVMLGVATMIVVNSVMAGFSEKMRDRLHGVLADVVVESYDLDGFYDSDEVMARIKAVAGDEVEAMAADDGDVRPDEVPGRRPVDHPPGPDHRHPARGAGQDRRLRRVPLRRQGAAEAATVGSRRRSRSPSRSSGTRPPAGCSSDGRPRTTRSNERPPEAARRAGPRPRRDHRLRARRRSTAPGTETDEFIAPPGTQDRPGLPQAGQAARAGLRRLHGRRLLQERDERVRLDPRLRPARTAPGDAAAGRRQGRGAVNQIQIKVKPGVDLDALAATLQTALERAPADVLPRLDLGAEAGAAAGGGGDRAEHPEHAPVLHHRRGRVRHPGDLLDDRRREDPRHRRPEGARRLDRRASGGSSSATACCWAWSAAASGWSAGLLFVRYINDDREVAEQADRPQGLRRHDLLLQRDPHPGRAAGRSPGSSAGALFIAAAASIWPAQRAAKLHPVRALRFE